MTKREEGGRSLTTAKVNNIIHTFYRDIFDFLKGDVATIKSLAELTKSHRINFASNT
jgi:hypothetical protein